jgi:ribonuclease HII
VDEVGRGCLAGPVVAAAVVLDPERYIPRISDSKTVTPLERERLYTQITRAAICWSVVGVDPQEIDRINIHQASLRAMQRAVMRWRRCPTWCSSTAEAFRVPDLPMAQRAWSRRHACTAIAAASIVAKVTRDRAMLELHGRIRATGSTATRATRRAITSTPSSRIGYSEAHRRSFRPPNLFDRI